MKTSLKIIAVLALVAGLYFGVKTMKSNTSASGNQASVTETTSTEPASQPTTPSNPRTTTTATAIKPATQLQPENGVQPTPTVTADPNVIPDWEQKIDDLLAPGGKSEAEAGKAILEMLPKLPPEGQIAAAQHISNLLANEDYAPFASYLTNSATSSEVQDVIFADLLNRPNNIKLPMLLEVARNGKGEQATEAKDFLEVFLGEDYGKDWNVWQTKMNEWLKENPDEPVPGSNGTAVSN